MNKFAIREYLAEYEKEKFLSNVKKVMEICADEQSKKIIAKIIIEWLNNESGDLEEICTDDQYFCEDIFSLSKEEIFVDCGAYNGDTMQEFLRKSHHNFAKMILFELSKNNFEDLQKNVKLLDDEIKNKMELFNKGISDRTDEIYYNELDEGSSEEKTGTSKGYLTTIDEACKDDRVSYIKMDIEGSEMAALKGARQCILKNKPKLAVCLYHKPQDIWEIPVYIKNMLPEYRIYIRHHTNLLNETVCYAVI